MRGTLSTLTSRGAKKRKWREDLSPWIISGEEFVFRISLSLCIIFWLRASSDQNPPRSNWAACLGALRSFALRWQLWGMRREVWRSAVGKGFRRFTSPSFTFSIGDDDVLRAVLGATIWVGDFLVCRVKQLDVMNYWTTDFVVSRSLQTGFIGR